MRYPPIVVPLLALLGAACAADPALSQEAVAPLTARTAVAEALRAHPLVRAAEQRLFGSIAHLRGARAPLNPEGILQHGFGTGTGGLDEDLSLSQVFELGGKRQYRGREAEGLRQRTAAELQVTRLQVAFDTRTAYLGVQEASALQGQTEEFLRLAEQFRAAAVAQFEAGEVPRTQVIRSEIEVSARQQALNEAQTVRQTQAATLNSLIGRPPLPSVVVAEPLAEPPPVDMLEAWRARVAERPEVQAARAELVARQAAVRSARAASYPNLFVTGVHARLDQGPGNSVRTGVIFPLWDRGRLRAMRAEARAAVGAGEADLAEALRRVDLELQVAYNQALQAEVRLQRYRSGQLEQARTLADLAQFGYENGHTSYLELLDAQRVFNETRAGYIRALADAARARLALERAAGSPSLLPVAPQEAPAR